MREAGSRVLCCTSLAPVWGHHPRPGGEDTQSRSPETSQLCAGNCDHLEGGCQLGRA